MHDFAQQIYQKVSPMPESLAKEILDFVNFLSYQHQDDILIQAQLPTMKRIWNNAEDDIWNDL